MASNDIVAEVNAFNSPQALVEYYGGTRRAAEALGVTQRTVQRYVTTAKQRSRPNKAMLARAAGVRSAAGVGVTFAGSVLIGSQPRDREINRVYSAEDWEELSAMAAKGDAEGCWQFVADEYQVSDFHLESGEILIGEE